MKSKEESVEVKTFLTRQKCTTIGCGGYYKETNSDPIVDKSETSFIHICNECSSLLLFNKKYPLLEYEEIENRTKPLQPDYTDFDDDIPF
ncbi:MAG: hypothetical protein K0U78_15030 [Actinomycetia bacterium]|nr:hypothetical protein [Actinomycetes bacterium]